MIDKKYKKIINISIVKLKKQNLINRLLITKDNKQKF